MSGFSGRDLDFDFREDRARWAAMEVKGFPVEPDGAGGTFG